MEFRTSGGMDRRRFLGVGAAGALFCTIGGETVPLETAKDGDRADQLARKVRRPKAKAAQAPSGVDALKFPTPTPAPGGVVREHWIQAVSKDWNIVPTGRDDWHGDKIPGKTTFRALLYQEMTPGFAEPVRPATFPGPTLRAEVGDLLVVHFRNADEHFEQALTMHPHGVHYNPDYDGTYLGDHTRVGGFIEPGEEFTYRWECKPDSVGAWPYHDHGPNHTLNTFRGLFGAVIIYPKGAKAPDVERILFLHSLQPSATKLERQFQAINGRSFAGNTSTVQAKVGQDVAWHVFGMDNNFHTFHIHGHRWQRADGVYEDCPTVGPNETLTARYIEDNPGRWLYHCHVFSHQMGMAGWYEVTP
jgi:FtsP/CotA-like multicopper oxidase with cupredoxin domain